MTKSPHVGLARKYRPQVFEDLVGQEAVAVTLQNAVASERPAHAYLFFGPRGVGKTTSARILAKALNCQKGPSPKPCGKCSSCEEITTSSSIDVLELDAASNTQVDKIREMIIETVSLAPSRDRFKIFIIDEVHMLSSSSFNALLKTLEEPPSHVIFVLATTELAKLPATIVSRCQRFRFRPVAVDTAAEYLGKIAKAEKIKADEEALKLLARAGGGAMRDSISLFDQAASFTKGGITAATVRELVGMLPADLVLGIVQSVLAKDASALAEWLAKATEEGYDPSEILRDLREALQELHLHALGVPNALASDWADLVQGRDAAAFAFLLRRVNQTLADLRSSDAPQLVFELGLYGLLESAYDLREWVGRLEALERRLSQGGASSTADAPARPSAPAAARPASKPAAVSAKPAAKPARPMEAPADDEPVFDDEPEVSDPARPAGQAPAHFWAGALTKLEAEKPALAGGLRESRLEQDAGDRWKLFFADSFKRDYAQKNQAVIETALCEASGRKISLAFEIDKTLAKAKAPEREAWVDSSEGEASDDPGVKKVLGAFGGRVKQVRKK